MDAANNNPAFVTWSWFGITVVLGFLATFSVVTLSGLTLSVLLVAATAIAWRQALNWGAIRDSQG